MIPYRLVRRVKSPPRDHGYLKREDRPRLCVVCDAGPPVDIGKVEFADGKWLAISADGAALGPFGSVDDAQCELVAFRADRRVIVRLVVWLCGLGER